MKSILTVASEGLTPIGQRYQFHYYQYRSENEYNNSLEAIKNIMRQKTTKYLQILLEIVLLELLKVRKKTSNLENWPMPN